MANLKRRIEELERQQLSSRPRHSVQFDEDALAIYCSVAYLDATMEPTYNDVEPSAAYARGKELRNARYGPIIPAYLDEHIKRFTRASGEFELAFGREPRSGDILRFEDVYVMHSPDNYSSHFGRFVEAWGRQLPQLACPVKFEEGRLFRRLTPRQRGEQSMWEEDVRIQPFERWLRIPEVLLNTDLEALQTITSLTFLGVGDAKHQCRPSTDEEMQREETELHIQKPTGFMLARQRFCELLVEVMGA